MSFLKKISSAGITDQDLVIQYRESGDIAALADLYQRYMDLLYGVCLKYLKDPERSKDAVMAIFEELVQKLKKHEVTYFKGWVYTVARNHCLMQLRAENHLPAIDFDPDRVQLTEELHLDSIKYKEWQFGHMEKCLETLSPDQKKAVKQFYLDEMSYKQIAAITGLEAGKVRSLIQNGRRNLKICMEARTGKKMEVKK